MTVAVSTVISMYDLATELLAVLVTAMTSTAAGTPNRDFVALGDPVFDTLCAQAIVNIPELGEGTTGSTTPAEATGMRHSRGRVNLVTMNAWALRCVSFQNGNVPVSDAQFDADALAGYEDGWAIWNYVTRLINAGELFSGPCGIVHFDGGIAVTPAGGLGGWRFACRVELGGYNPLP